VVGTKDIKIGARCINAMAETVATKPPFRDAFPRRQRCIVPARRFLRMEEGARRQAALRDRGRRTG